jgi:hypothetical protein
MSPKTVATYRMRLMGKLQLKNTAQLTRYAIQHESDMTIPIAAQPELRPLIAPDAMRMLHLSHRSRECKEWPG